MVCCIVEILFQASSSMEPPNTLKCGVCGQLFQNKQNRVKHERFSKSCGGKVPPPENILKHTVNGEVIKVMNVTDQEVELAG